MPFDTFSPALAAAAAGVYYCSDRSQSMARFQINRESNELPPLGDQEFLEFFVAGDAIRGEQNLLCLTGFYNLGQFYNF